MKTSKLNGKKINPFDLSSVAKNTQAPNKKEIASLRSSDVYSAGGKNASSNKDEDQLRKSSR